MLKPTSLHAAVALSLGAGNLHAAQYSMTFMDFPGSPNSTVEGTFDSTSMTGTITSGATPFFGHAWTGTLAFASTSASSWQYTTAEGSGYGTGTYNFTLGAGQVAMGILFDWKTSSGIPILNIVNADGSGVDIDGDGVLGTAMADGPFAGTPVGFAGTLVPVPAAVWLMASGLMGLVGVARRR